jgi:hypothetical protein
LEDANASGMQEILTNAAIDFTCRLAQASALPRAPDGGLHSALSALTS